MSERLQQHDRQPTNGCLHFSCSDDFTVLVKTLKNAEQNVADGRFRWSGGKTQQESWSARLATVDSMECAQALLDIADKHLIEVRGG